MPRQSPVIFRCSTKAIADALEYDEWPYYDRMLVVKSHSDKGGWLVIGWHDKFERTPKTECVRSFDGPISS